jgi:hypothetical protein
MNGPAQLWGYREKLGARSLGVCVVAAAAAFVLWRGAVQHGSSTAGLAFAQLAGAHALVSSPSSNADGPALAAITVDYPEQGSIFPPEITPPTFLWRNASNSASVWTIDVAFGDGSAGIRAESAGERLRIGEIDPRCVSASNELPKLTPQQAAARTWIPDAASWELIKRQSKECVTGRRSNQLNYAPALFYRRTSVLCPLGP